MPPTPHYADLWYAACTAQLPTATDAQPMTSIDAFRQDAWTHQDPRLPDDCATTLTPQRHRDNAPCDDYARRQALVEFDALAANALGLTLDELRTIYRIQFWAVRQYRVSLPFDNPKREQNYETAWLIDQDA